MRKLNLVLLVSSAALLAACNGSSNHSSEATSNPVTITLLHTNDTHSQVESFGSTPEGGYARRKTLIDSIRSAKGADNTLLVDAGDYFQGSIFYNAWKGSEAVMGLNHMGYEVVTIGNHEFDMGPEELARALRGGPVTIADVGYSTEVMAPTVVSANLDVSAEPYLTGLIEPYTIVEKGGEKFGIIGVVTETVTHISNIGANVVVHDYLSSVQNAVNELKAEGINKIILLSHAGYTVDLDRIPELSGVDVVVSGHDHVLLGDADTFAADSTTEALAEDVKGPYPTVAYDADGSTVLVVSANEWGRILGQLDVSFDASGHVATWTGTPWYVGESITEDASLAQTVAEYKAPVEAFSEVVIGSAGMLFDGSRDPGVRTQEMPIGNLVTDTMLATTAESDGAVAALTNGGGLRATIEAGTVTFGDALSVLPFGNTISVVEVTGSELIAALDNGLTWAYDPVAGATQSSGSFPQIAGMQVTYCAATVEAIRAGTTPPSCGGALLSGGVVTSLNVAGAPVSKSASYRVATNNFLASGGDFYASLEEACQRSGGYCRDTGVLMLDELVDEFQTASPLSREVEGRIVGQ